MKKTGYGRKCEGWFEKLFCRSKLSDGENKIAAGLR